MEEIMDGLHGVWCLFLFFSFEEVHFEGYTSLNHRLPPIPERNTERLQCESHLFLESETGLLVMAGRWKVWRYCPHLG